MLSGQFTERPLPSLLLSGAARPCPHHRRIVFFLFEGTVPHFLSPLSLPPIRTTWDSGIQSFLVSSYPFSPSLRTELQEKESVNEALMGSVDEGPMTSSSHQYPSGSHEPPSTKVFLSEEHEDVSALVAATDYSHQQEKKAPTGLPGSVQFMFPTFLSSSRYVISSVWPWRLNLV